MDIDTHKYAKYQIAIFAANTVVLTMGILIYVLDFGSYGRVLYNETAEWNQTAIVDVTSLNDYDGTCPTGYELLTGNILGTKTYCSHLTYYTLTSCSSKSTGRTHYGLTPEALSAFDDTELCYKRGTENFHALAANRLTDATFDATCDDGYTMCGPSDISLGHTYCVSGTVCPVTDLVFYKGGNKNKDNWFESKGLNVTEVVYNTNWTFYQIWNQAAEPVASLYINLSPPCGDTS